MSGITHATTAMLGSNPRRREENAAIRARSIAPVPRMVFRAPARITDPDGDAFPLYASGLTPDS